MGNVKVMDLVSDAGSILSYGIINIKKGRINVPFSGAMIGDYLKGWGNLATGEQLRGGVNDTLSSPLAKNLETVVGAIAGAVATAGIGSALTAPASAAEAGAVGAEGAVTPLAAGESGAIATGAVPAIGTAASGSATIAEAMTPTSLASLTTPAVGVGADGAAALTGGPITASSTPTTVATGVDASEAAQTALTPGVNAGENLGGVSNALRASGTQADALNIPAITNSSSGVLSTPQAGSSVPSIASGINPEAVTANTSNMIRGYGATDLGQAARSFVAAPSTAGWWASLTPQTQAAIAGSGIFVGGQMVTGGLGGLFAGATAHKKLELEQLINQQNQTQRLYWNKNNTYVPKLAFNKPAGVLATPK